ncbi:autotransporter outer membrane beta-barrel domain-containing protein [Ralstonia chuxiongensis]|uniref:Autotransporter outer membrane beta-barrel domain-containing protein n=1 Tax=Ralstonia chuxiongensis TaxID=2957504 RepID=A0AA41WP00_9RALS|nr:autotransporter outer membrane beta-barrel domain-containing protein [Ralstonia chuxiongensis]MCP1171756.1 autotransporter outer membrane beta-barrel domain-containing protein [Ralstonia chuxiongensis]
MSTPLFQRRRGRLQFVSIALVASPFALFGALAHADCTTTGQTTVCDTAAPNPATSTVGTGNVAAEDNRTVTVQNGSTLAVGDTSAIAVRDNANITVQTGGTVSANAVSNSGFYGTGGNAIDFRNNSTLTVQQGAQVLANGTQLSGEAVNPEGTGNTIVNDGLIKSAHGAAIWFQNTSGGNTVINNATGTIQTDVANGNVMGASGNGSVDFTNRGKVIGNLIFAGGNDALHFYTGSSVSGSISGGGGANVITLNGTDSATLGTITNFQTLQKQDSGTWTLSKTLASMGVTNAEVQQGTLILQGNNGTYTGTMQVDAGGTLQGDALSVTKAVTNNGLVRFQQDADGSYAGQIVGAGALEKTGTGTLTLGAGNTYSGGTTITQGTLAIGADSALGGATGALTFNGGTLQLTGNVDVAATRAIDITNANGTIDTQGFTSTVSQGISGVGALTKAGGGTLVLAGDNTYQGGTTVAAGTLQLGNGGTSGSILGNVVDNGTLTFNRSDVFTFGGTVSGTGGITQAGTGTTVLTANNAIQGDTLVASGALAIGDATHTSAALGVSATNAPQSLRPMAGSSGSNVQIAANATLGGYGTVNGAVTNNGTVAVADALAAFANSGSGSLTINGSLNNAGTVQVGGAGVGNKLVVNGNYVGNGGVLAINTKLGTDNSPTDKLVISGGTASGNTAVRVTNAGGAGARTTGDGIEVVSAINGATTQANAFALANRVVAGPYEYTLQRGGSASADSWYLRTLQTVTEGTGGAGTGTTQPALRQEVSLYTAIPSLTLLYGRALLDTLHERVGEESNQATAPAGTSPVLRTGWARVIAQKGSRMSDGNGIYGNQGPAFSYDFGGVQFGADVYQRQREDGSHDHAGGYFATGRIAADVTHADGADAGRDTVNANTVGLYWTHFGPSGWYLDGVVQGTRYDADASPHGVNGLKTHALGYAASLEAGYPIALSQQWRVEPQAQLVYQRAAFADANDGAADVRFNSVNSMLGRLGVRVSKRWGESPERQHTAWLRANVWHEFRGETGTQMSSPDGGFVPFTSQLPSTTLELTGGLTAQVAKNGVFYASLGYQVSADRRLHGVNGKAGVRWGW